MSKKQQLETLIKKIYYAGIENSKNLKKEESIEKISFLYGYKMALNDVGTWLEIEMRQKNKH